MHSFEKSFSRKEQEEMGPEGDALIPAELVAGAQQAAELFAGKTKIPQGANFL